MRSQDVINNYKGIKRIICKVTAKILSPYIAYYDTLFAENIEKMNIQLNECLKKIDDLQEINTLHKIKINVLEKKYGEILSVNKDSTKNSLVSKETDIYSGIDYFDFENYFRGSVEIIKERQKNYLSYFEGQKNVIDLGCGRGEFLELLSENNIDAYGVDTFETFVELCKLKNLKVICADALEILEKEEKIGGIFASQLVEHLSIEQIIKLCDLAYEKLENGACIIIETPNPTSLAIYTNAFYIDPSHNKPVHPLTLKYILEKAGFDKIEIIFTKESEVPVKIPMLQGDGINNMDEFNDSMQFVQKMLFGSQDYAIIAWR